MVIEEPLTPEARAARVAHLRETLTWLYNHDDWSEVSSQVKRIEDELARLQ